MSEEEIIEQLEDRDMLIDCLYENFNQSTVKPFEKAISGLLDLYNKEKEKNKELEKENWIMRTIDKQYISKDKIREIQNKIHQILNENGITRAYQLIVDKEFKKLLEEE